MTTKDAFDYLERLGEIRMRLGLDPTLKTLSSLDHPDRNLKSVIVAGTNGKGSTCAFLTEIAKTSGIRVGTFTSPHLEHVTERICINGNPIEIESICDHITRLAAWISARDLEPLTYFEFLTVLSVLVFVEANVDLAILEVGLGGRLDSTNALQRIATAITRIDLDHMHLLGDTPETIALEKGAIMRPDIPCVVGKQTDTVEQALRRMGGEIGATLIWANKLPETPLGLHGVFQKENAAIAVSLAHVLVDSGVAIDSATVETALSVTSNPGRLELWTDPQNRNVWIDVAHNPGAVRAVRTFFKDRDIPIASIVLGMVADKDAQGVIRQLEQMPKQIILCSINSPRSWHPLEVCKRIKASVPLIAENHAGQALERALSLQGDVLCIGSFYGVSSYRKMLRSLKFSPKTKAV